MGENHTVERRKAAKNKCAVLNIGEFTPIPYIVHVYSLVINFHGFLLRHGL